MLPNTQEALTLSNFINLSYYFQLNWIFNYYEYFTFNNYLNQYSRIIVFDFLIHCLI